MTSSRRCFVRTACGSLAAGALQAAKEPLAWNPDAPFLNVTRPLKVQPVFMYRIQQKKEQTSWRSWGGVQTEEAARQEMAHIGRELAALPHRFLPVAPVSSPEQAARVHEGDHDALLLYACTGSGQLFTSCVSPRRDTLVFVRQSSGPVYYWYEALSSRYLSSGDTAAKLHVDDVVVDDYTDLASKLRGLNGARNLLGTRIVALGGAMGKYAPDAPDVARSKYKMEIVEAGYDDFGKRVKAARADARLAAAAQECARRYVQIPGTTLRTELKFVANCFLLYHLFQQLLAEHNATAFTVQSCMNTIIPMSETTACLTLSLMNDDGTMAFCESDFVIIPAGILLRHISGTPVFLHNSTFPHGRMVTCAHCTAPRRMNARDYHPAQILTHYESDCGAAPKVEIPPGQEVTFIDPEYTAGRWVGIRGIVRENPFYEICRSQQNVEIQGHWEALKAEARDSHWVMAYGNRLAESGYAARKLGVRWYPVV
ncbi:MAG: sugar isomerase [Acidobacteria bacterium]|nr:sugar isomerase [Acidobacteriota bacterium]